jgi:hypothetical protein
MSSREIEIGNFLWRKSMIWFSWEKKNGKKFFVCVSVKKNVCNDENENQIVISSWIIEIHIKKEKFCIYSFIFLYSNFVLHLFWKSISLKTFWNYKFFENWEHGSLLVIIMVEMQKICMNKIVKDILLWNPSF